MDDHPVFPALAPRRPALSARLKDWGTRARTALGSWWCGLAGGHDRVPQVEAGRLLLRCMHCGHASPGWDLRGERRYQRTYAGDPSRTRLQRTNVVPMPPAGRQRSLRRGQGHGKVARG